MNKVHLDFETRSVLPFGSAKGAVTAYQYARHPSTEILCLSYSIGDDAPIGWTPHHAVLGGSLNTFREYLKPLIQAVNQGTIVAAHNAGFEYLIWKYVFTRYAKLCGLTSGIFPELPISQMDCTAYRAAIMSLPRSLDGASKALRLKVSKDMTGKKTMMQMAKPRKARKDEDPEGIYWHFDADRLRTLMSYCDDDVIVERELDKVVRPVTSGQRELWLRDHACNMRGVHIDQTFAKKAQKVFQFVERRYIDELHNLTGGEVQSPTSVPAMKAWVEAQGVDVTTLTKVDVENLLKEDLPENVKRVLQIRQEAGKSSVAKYIRYTQLISEDSVMRENFLLHGASTGRDSGKGAQLQNLPSRGGLKYYHAEQVIEIVREATRSDDAVRMIELLYDATPQALSSCLRGTITARPGTKLFVGDYSNIEGRIAAWFGNEQWKLQAFRDYDTFVYDENSNPELDQYGDHKRKGPDLYKVTAAEIVGITPDEVDSVLRNIMGKITELALGFEGGEGAFQSMASNFNVDMSEYWDVIQRALRQDYIDKAYSNWDSYGHQSGIRMEEWLPSNAVKLAWRDRNSGIAKSWKDAQACAISAIKTPDKWFHFAERKCSIASTKVNGIPFLVYRLPSGRKIYAAGATLKPVTRFGKVREQIEFYKVHPITKQWGKATTYGGDIFQSFVQGTAADVMFNGWKSVEEEEFKCVVRVHDELGSEADPATHTIEQYLKAMERLPTWAKGLPLSAAGYSSHRYRKD